MLTPLQTINLIQYNITEFDLHPKGLQLAVAVLTDLGNTRERYEGEFHAFLRCLPQLESAPTFERILRSKHILQARDKNTWKVLSHMLSFLPATPVRPKEEKKITAQGYDGNVAHKERAKKYKAIAWKDLIRKTI